MTTEFILSLLGLGIVGGGLGLGVLYALYRWRNKKPLTFNYSVRVYLSILLILGAFSGYNFLTSSYSLAKKGVGYAVDKGQDLVSSAMSFGMVTVIDGFGKTSEHYESKWEKKKLTQNSKMDFEVIAVKEKKAEEKAILQITFSAKNGSSKTLSLNEMIKDELILLKDEKGLCFPLRLTGNRELTIAPYGSLVSEVEVALPNGVSVTEFITPSGAISLGR